MGHLICCKAGYWQGLASGKTYYKLRKTLQTEGSYQKVRHYIGQSWSKNLFPTPIPLVFLFSTKPSRDTSLQIRPIWFQNGIHKIRRNRPSEGSDLIRKRHNFVRARRIWNAFVFIGQASLKIADNLTTQVTKHCNRHIIYIFVRVHKQCQDRFIFGIRFQFENI